MKKMKGEYYEGNWILYFACMLILVPWSVFEKTHKVQESIIMVVPDITAICYVTQCSVTECYQSLIESVVSLAPAESTENGYSRFVPTPAYFARLNGDTFP